MTEEEMSPMLNKLKVAGLHGTSDIIVKQGRELLSLRLEVEWLQSELAAARAQALEEAAKVCDGIESEKWHLWKTHYDMLDQGRSDGAGDCAAAIRAMLKKEP